MKKHKFKTIRSNSVDGANSTNATWGFKPVPNKGGNTNNSMITNKEGNKDA